jgi:DNA topoisomerase VI subunit B
MAVKLERQTFERSLAGDYFDARKLSATTGVWRGMFAEVCLKELVDNNLDACEAAGVAPEIDIYVEGRGEDGVHPTAGKWITISTKFAPRIHREFIAACYT